MGSQVGLESIPAAFGQQARYTVEWEDEEKYCFDWPSISLNSACVTITSCWKYMQIYVNIESFMTGVRVSKLPQTSSPWILWVWYRPLFDLPGENPHRRRGEPADLGPSCWGGGCWPHIVMYGIHVWSKHFPSDLVWKDCFLMTFRHCWAELTGHGK